jgi:protein ImuB
MAQTPPLHEIFPPPVFAVLHIPEFELQAVLRIRPNPTRPPAALFATSSKRSVVLAANAPARARGVEVGMTAPQAVARCPDLLIHTPQPEATAEARAALLAVGFTLSPAVEDTAPGLCTVDLRSNPTPVEPLATAALTQLSVLGLCASAGIARTPLLALYAARAAARTASDRSSAPALEPELPLVSEAPGAYVTHADRVCTVRDEQTFLAPLPLAVIEPAAEHATVLHAWGIRTLGELTALPKEELVRRFGSAGLALWQRANGGEPRPLHLFAPAQQFSATMELEHEIETLEPLLFVVRRFLERLSLELRAAQLVAAEIALTLRLEDASRHTREFRLPEPTADVEILFRTLHTHLEALSTSASIAAVEIQLKPTRPLVRQHGLFDTGLRDPHGFAETLARVAALVHADRVGTPQLADTHRPDVLKLVTPTEVIPPLAAAPVHPPFGLPLRRFRQPLLATLEFDQGQRRPTFVYTHRFCGDIVELRGPWRSSGEWWENERKWERLEYDIALTDGGLYRLIQVGDAFLIEGEYD